MTEGKPVLVSEIHRTAPYTFDELAKRWACDEATVRRRVGNRFIKPGRFRMVRPGTLLRIEEQMEKEAAA